MNERTPIDQIGTELHEAAQAYAAKAEGLASDPYFRDSVVKSSVSSFVWALYDAFSKDDRSLETLRDELEEQWAALRRQIDAEKEQA